MGTTESAFNLLSTLPAFFSSCLILSFKYLINWQNSLQSNLCFGRTCTRFIYNCPISKHQIYFHCCFCYREIFTLQRLWFFRTLFSRRPQRFWISTITTIATTSAALKVSIYVHSLLVPLAVALKFWIWDAGDLNEPLLRSFLSIFSSSPSLQTSLRILLWASQLKHHIHPNLSLKAKTTL